MLLVVSIVAIGFGVIMPRFEKIERSDMRAKSTHLSELIDAQVEKITAQVGTNAAWDSLYSYVQIPDEEFAATELGDQSSFVADVSSYVVLSTEGEVLYENGYDQEADAPRTESLFGDALLAPDSPLVSPVLNKEPLAGLVNVNGVPVLFSAAPITNAAGDAPPLGEIIMARVVDSKIVAKLTDGLKSDVAIYPLNKIPAGAPKITDADHVALSTSGSSINGWLDVRDLSGTPVAIGQVTTPRTLTAVGRQTVRDITLAVAAMCLVASFGLLYAINRAVVSRLTRLASDSAALDLSKPGSRVAVDGTDEIASVAHGMNFALENLDVVMSSINTGVQRVREQAELLDRIAAEVDTAASNNAIEASAAADEVSAITLRLHEVATNTEDLSQSIHEISNHSAEAVTATRSATSDSVDAKQTVSDLSEVSSRIDEVVQLIGQIADQTNLLALNATIEAARAGDAGRGFGVVANEVKDLAQQTAEGTHQITEQIQAIQKETKRAVIAIANVATTILKADDIQHVIADAVARQDTTMRTIAGNTSEVSQSTKKISSHVESLASGAHDAERSAGELRATAKALNALAVDLQVSLLQQEPVRA